MNNYLGIDTSNYKTSIAVVDDEGKVLYEKSELLNVGKGEKGLRQSEAFFMHSNILPVFIEEAFKVIPPSSIKGIAYSSKPRNIEGSYMPVFLAGENTSKTLASSLEIPIIDFSHQEGHIEAVISTASTESDDKFILYHLSGGTTEILLCEKNNTSYQIKIIGGTKDISIGQLFDRVGVTAGFPFPSGSYLDEIATNDAVNNNTFGIELKRIKNTDGYFNLSGIETDLIRKLNNNYSINEIAPALFSSIADLLYSTAISLAIEHNVKQVYFAGGVASSNTLRNILYKNYDYSNISIVFGDSKLSGDNAVGIARLGRKYFIQ